MAQTTPAEVMAELAGLEDPKAREVNERHGDDHGVNYSVLKDGVCRQSTAKPCCGLLRPVWR
ncbi:hypothetical protein MBT84_01900 [Streptomyces sp. MBT84]|nr:hypothetical protein [Streptomyces sp. MBT84]